MSSRERIERLEFHISYACVNDCIFCSEKTQLDKFNNVFVDLADIKKELLNLDNCDINHITLTGGEPSLHPAISDILKFCKQKNYKTYITTNGGRFSDENFVKKILPMIDEICFSIHGYNDASHDALTCKKGSFLKLSKAIANVKNASNKINVFANIVATKDSMVDILKVLSFVKEWEMFGHIIISNIAPEGRAKGNYKKLAPRLEDWCNNIEIIKEAVEKTGANYSLFGLPLCVLGTCRNKSNDIGFSPRITIEKWDDGEKVYYKKTISMRAKRKRVKPKICEVCIENENCEGIFEEYHKIYGHDELKSIK